MCEVCGCDDDASATALNMQTGKLVPARPGPAGAHVHVLPDGSRYVHTHGHEAHHAHPQAHSHSHEHEHAERDIETRVLAKNDALAARNREWLGARRILALNLMSAPGAGKTTLLERTIRDLRHERPLFVVEGDQATANDGERIRAAGASAVQVNTGTGCHLDAAMVARALEELDPPPEALVVIENVGNLVCPALFDVGEQCRVVIFSVTEGDDKPLKYPHMFRTADLVVLNKIDLLSHVDFDVERAVANVRAVNAGAEVLTLSARTGENLGAWYDWLARRTRAARSVR